MNVSGSSAVTNCGISLACRPVYFYGAARGSVTSWPRVKQPAMILVSCGMPIAPSWLEEVAKAFTLLLVSCTSESTSDHKKVEYLIGLPCPMLWSSEEPSRRPSYSLECNAESHGLLLDLDIGMVFKYIFHRSNPRHFELLACRHVDAGIK